MKNNNTKSSNITAISNPLKNINPNVAGVDIGAGSIYICAPISSEKLEVREFLTVTADLKAAAKWLKTCKVTSVAMESTGSYWIPTFEIFEEAGLEVVLANAYHLKAVPGRKTDVKDCQWIQHLHSLGLLRGSFRPKKDAVEFRAYVRQRSKLIELLSMQAQLMNKALIQMNIRLDRVLSDITGVSGFAIIRAIVAGERDPKKLALHRNYRCSKTTEEVILALEGNFRSEHIFALKQALESHDFLKNQISECEQEIKKHLDIWNAEQEKQNAVKSPADTDNKVNIVQAEQTQKTKKLSKNAYDFNADELITNACGVDLTKVPGIDTSTAIKIISEIGRDVSAWGTAKQFASWMGLCPGNKISGGRILSGRIVPTKNRVKQAFLMAASTLHHSTSALGAFYRRMRSRLGAPKAVTATAHKLATIVYNMLKNGSEFYEIGQEAYEKRYEKRTIANLKANAAKFGYVVVKAEQKSVA